MEPIKGGAATLSIMTFSITKPGSTKANGREPKTCLARVFNNKLGCFKMCMYLSMLMHAHIYSWKLGPSLVLLARLSVTTFSITINKTRTLSIMADHCYAECHLCWVSFILSVTFKPYMLSVVMWMSLCKVSLWWVSWCFTGYCYEVRFPLLQANIRHGWKWKTMTNTLAFYGTKLITVINNFIE